MGLDVIVNVRMEYLSDLISELEDPVAISEANRILFNMDKKAYSVRTSPGSYAGIHRVRMQYSIMKGWWFGTGGHLVLKWNSIPFIEGPAKISHLINHSDCDGWYLPEDFEEPQWVGSISIGSSQRLLAELLEMLPSIRQWRYDVDYSWDAIFIAAVASVVSNEPIKFN